MHFDTIAQYKRKNAPGQGRKKEGRTASTIALLPEMWEIIDAIRGEESRGKAIEKLIQIAVDSAAREEAGHGMEAVAGDAAFGDSPASNVSTISPAILAACGKAA